MDKNWLIRTKSNHILGPISKEKVLELYKNGSIKSDDEITSGNGFWFFVREDDMVARFLTGQETQGFNPISEAKDVLTNGETVSIGPMEPDDITLVGEIDLSALNNGQQSPPALPPASEREHRPLEIVPTPETKKKNSSQVKSKSTSTPVKKPLKKQSYLKYFGAVGFIILFLLIYFRKTIIRSLFHGELTEAISHSILDSAMAQEDIPEKKKSS